MTLFDTLYVLRTPTGAEVEVELKKGQFYGPARVKNNQPIMCSCTGTTKETATVMEAVEGVGAVCPKCGKTLAIIRSPADHKAEVEEKARQARENLHLVPAGMTEDFGTAYRLTARLERTEWAKIASHMLYVTTDDAMGMDADDHNLGWVTFYPQAVEEALGITGDRTVAARREAAKQRREDPILTHKHEITRRVKEIAHEIRETGERPGGTNDPAGDRLFDTQDVYGGGDWFVVGPEYLWYIQNNGMDGDNWGLNNVRTGGAGAIGYRVPTTSLMTAELRRLASETDALTGGEQ